MTDKKPMMVYAATCENVSAAEADLDAIEQLHKDDVIGSFDAAVIDQENGKPHVVKRMDRPAIRVIPEWFGGETLPRKDLHQVAQQLTAGQAGPIAVGEPRIESARRGAHQRRQGGEADRGCHDRRNHQRAAGSAQGLGTCRFLASARAATRSRALALAPLRHPAERTPLQVGAFNCSWGAIRPAPVRAQVTSAPKMNPPTCAKNATPPPFAWALNSPKLASTSWYKNHSPRKIQAGIRTRKTGKIHVRTREPGYSRCSQPRV
jgi:hypothetical protein